MSQYDSCALQLSGTNAVPIICKAWAFMRALIKEV